MQHYFFSSIVYLFILCAFHCQVHERNNNKTQIKKLTFCKIDAESLLIITDIYLLKCIFSYFCFLTANVVVLRRLCWYYITKMGRLPAYNYYCYSVFCVIYLLVELFFCLKTIRRLKRGLMDQVCFWISHSFKVTS